MMKVMPMEKRIGMALKGATTHTMAKEVTTPKKIALLLSTKERVTKTVLE